MRLVDFLSKIYECCYIWVSTDPNVNEGIYFGAAGSMEIDMAKKYEVVEFYVESYKAIYGGCGISIIVRELP